MTARDDGGQATVEFALALPLLAMLLLAVVQVGLVVRDQAVLTHAAREAARAVAVRDTTGGPAELVRVARQAARSAAGRALEDDRLTVEAVERGGSVTVRLGYRSPLTVPLLRFPRKDVRLAAFALMHREID